MRRIVEILYAVAALVMLSGCASPPEPVQPEWNTPGAAVNATLPQWSENRIVVPSADVDGHWSTYIVFSPEAIYPPGVWYAVAHSEKIVINTPDGTSYFRAKSWLRKHGYRAVVTYQPKATDCLACHATEIYFYR
ncbi:cag pathogenicity island Cag12 family protein [Gibbsiella quercinecans]|uniref:cag pathogenicity island Cag12 family protein n=1 Tax=Gibbsiella quercinecans TaxID=929813 RepID=UPI001E4E2F10|nr:cag pathogenicity island Cag12 family protein [Gibbsiella quercinecans]